MPHTKRDMVIAVCRVAPAHAIPDRDKEFRIWNGRRELLCPIPEDELFSAFCADILGVQAEFRIELTAVTSSGSRGCIADGLPAAQGVGLKCSSQPFCRASKATGILRIADSQEARKWQTNWNAHC
jgi:hypothetical protein